MQLIKSLAEIDYKNSAPLNFLATVISVDSEGDGERKKPFKATLKLEESGELVQVCSWKFDVLDVYKELVLTDDVYIFEGTASLYRDTEKQIRAGDIKNANMKSSKKILRNINIVEIKREIESIVNTYIPKEHVYRKILDDLVFNNEKFWKWPAATKMHHAFTGGLAKHTLSTLKNAISLWKNYAGSNLNIVLIVAGAILHDIGKLTEYNADGTRTVYGNLVPHPVSGYSKVYSEAEKLSVDPEKDSRIIMLLHTILCHHEKLEFGASTQPGIFEALIIARSDAVDAACEAIDENLNNIETNTTTDRLIALDGMRFFKWHN